ncbi:TetR/AcrR family transcriptional regulator [Fructilactobacillus myrtifloralis]|uniref:TetR/AcrR family transcriptional regulator n=1 Tax=Fructilactobacillus myrtifloralis TaxID=2940301 RepID=A0ABY5BP09_9LACO|nr:TetR/AcrR family transcriptional regulator [Fructilactobacillus myrtifloralis]USS84818.1 TetR/AcrR family transcriptional regulator [Fructilactobacillus myrtifloralis]
MPTSTFEKLPAEKQARINAALLTEFSAYSLAEAQVARIVADAEISRGSFYKYFNDISDAYRHEFQQVMSELHAPFKRGASTVDVSEMVRMVAQFVTESTHSEYRSFMRLYYQRNQYLLPTDISPRTPTEREWASSVLIHQSIKEILLNPERQADYLARLERTLTQLFS